MVSAMILFIFVSHVVEVLSAAFVPSYLSIILFCFNGPTSSDIIPYLVPKGTI